MACFCCRRGCLCLLYLQYWDALSLCAEHHIPMTDSLVEKLSPATTAGLSDEERCRVLETVGEVCCVQGQYRLAAKKFTQAGSKVKVCWCTVRSDYVLCPRHQGGGALRVVVCPPVRPSIYPNLSLKPGFRPNVPSDWQQQTTTVVLRPIVQDYTGEPVPEETFTHPPIWSSSNHCYLLPSTTIHSILPVQSTCLAIFLHNLSPCPLWSTSWSGALHLIFHTFLHPIIF